MKRTRWILAPSLVASALAATLPVQAQLGEVVQATPSAEAVASLNRNLASLSRNPQDVTALLGAGQAALDLGDVQAANGFYTRANMVNPQLGKAKLGLAVVQIGLKQPVEAAANFDAAEALGEPAQKHLAERGLAYDLTGQQEKAQRDYQAALQASPGDERTRLRYAVSLGISGKIAESDRQLETALAAGDREAWRMRAFVLAMNGRITDARKVTQTVMPKGLADALDPYMQRLPLLTTGQKAAAAYYGEFPANVLKLAAPEPARDVQVAAATTERQSSRRDRRSRTTATERPATSRQSSTRTASATPPAAAPASTPPPLTPPAPASTPPQTSRSQTPTQVALNQAPPPAQSTTRTQQPTATPPRQSTFEAPATVQPGSTNAAPTRPATTLAQGPSDPARAPAVAPTQVPVSTPGQSASMPPRTTTVPATTVPVTTAPAPANSSPTPAPGFSSAAQPVSTVSLADAVSALEVPEQERQNTASVADFNAVARIQDQRRKANEAAAAKAKAEAEAKAKADAAKKAEAERKAKLAANPSRNWVQIATGRDVDALAFDMRRMRRTYADAVGDLDGWTAEWGATRRLLVGPFKKPEDAKAVVAKITKSGGDAFLWQSEAGEEVSKIGGK